MAKIHYDADLGLIRARKVAILGYGPQGHAHALNLKDSGVHVRVGLPASSASRAKAEAHGLTVTTPAEAAAWADVIMVLTPDTGQAALYQEAIAPHLTPGKTLMFAHGFNIRYGCIEPPALACVGQSVAQTPLSPCAAASCPAVSRISGPLAPASSHFYLVHRRTCRTCENMRSQQRRSRETSETVTFLFVGLMPAGDCGG